MNIESFLKSAADIPGRTAIQLAAMRLATSEASLLAWPDREVPSNVLAQLERDLQALRAGTPVAYVFGEIPFLHWDFSIDARALSPRPETEALCDWTIKRCKDRTPQTVLDLCCGSGVMGLSMALAFPQSHVILTDISERAIGLAQENSERHGLQERVEIHCGDLWQAVPAGSQFDLLVCNPPYVARDDEVQAEVLEHEPHQALFSDDSGMAHVKRILSQLLTFLKPDGLACFELGHYHKELLNPFLANHFGDGRHFWVEDPFGIQRFLIYDGRLREDGSWINY